jgi:hypothetical protein
MPQPYSPAPPDKQQIRLLAMDDAIELSRWTHYTFASNFLSPSDGWSLTIGGDNLSEQELSALGRGVSQSRRMK